MSALGQNQTFASQMSCAATRSPISSRTAFGAVPLSGGDGVKRQNAGRNLKPAQ